MLKVSGSWKLATRMDVFVTAGQDNNFAEIVCDTSVCAIDESAIDNDDAPLQYLFHGGNESDSEVEIFDGDQQPGDNGRGRDWLAEELSNLLDVEAAAIIQNLQEELDAEEADNPDSDDHEDEQSDDASASEPGEDDHGKSKRT